MTLERDENGLTAGQRAWADAQVDGDDFHTIALEATRWEPAGDGRVRIFAEPVEAEHEGVVTLTWIPPLPENERDAEAAETAARLAAETAAAQDAEVERRVAAEVARLEGEMDQRIAAALDARLARPTGDDAEPGEGVGKVVSEPAAAEPATPATPGGKRSRSTS